MSPIDTWTTAGTASCCVEVVDVVVDAAVEAAVVVAAVVPLVLLPQPASTATASARPTVIVMGRLIVHSLGWGMNIWWSSGGLRCRLAERARSVR